MGVRDRGRRERLAPEPLAALEVAGDVGRQDLERGEPAGVVLAAVDDSHAALPELALDRPRAQPGARRQEARRRSHRGLAPGGRGRSLPSTLTARRKPVMSSDPATRDRWTHRRRTGSFL